ncbi:MOSC domain-containing protein [Saccharobesus litoralis]|uniref:MOSC domain-containing protein n=1 Tax=Saccharobesus litoralis TaxID=2172099 RepID=A0A2S0VS28_9ALTE|nr:MOSC N-terminal beta barrel domain-containing protein [Saccharobesus litoralis]AWB67018.1 MOSC domain-containing protein [Saccharobesus litoralis]
MPEISAIYIYPVKSLGGIKLKSAKLGVRGLAYDRHWMITDENYEFVTQRSLAEMALIEVWLNDSHLTLSKVGLEDLIIPLDKTFSSSDKVLTKVWRDKVQGLNEGLEASEWLTRALGLYRGQPLQLVRMPDGEHRQVDSNYLPKQSDYNASLDTESTQTAYSDGFPFLIASEDSLLDLNTQLLKNGSQGVAITRFRANIVVKGLTAWQENHIDTIAVKGKQAIRFALCKPCERCPITKIDPLTAQVPDKQEPLQTLSTMDTQVNFKGAYFGQNAILLDGDKLEIDVGSAFEFTNKSTTS